MSQQHKAAWSAIKERPAAFPLATERPDVCPKCGSRVEQEPFAAHCRMCGTVVYLVGVDGVQHTFERVSGLVSSRLDSLHSSRTLGVAVGSYATSE